MRWSRALVTWVLLLGAALLEAPPLAAQTSAPDAPSRPNDFPTIERVLFVEACVRDYPDRSRTEMLYKCSCVIDGIAQALTYEEFVDASTAFAAGQVAGVRGAQVRDSSTGQDLAGRFRTARSDARLRCMMP